jgi:hypothetical protein
MRRLSELEASAAYWRNKALAQNPPPVPQAGAQGTNRHL